MLPHEERVLKERKELTSKINSLERFLGAFDILANLSVEELSLLRRQYEAMLHYEDLLRRRIRLFKGEF